MPRFASLWLAAMLALPAWAGTQNQLLVQDSPLAGFQFYAGKKLWEHIRIGDALMLVREPDNPYDANAIRVEWQGIKLGYVPRRENADAARLMDRGVQLRAQVTRMVKTRDPWQRIRFEIFAPIEPIE